MLIICKESDVAKAEQMINEDLATKAGTVAGFAVGATVSPLVGVLGAVLARRLMRDRIMFNKQLTRAKKVCKKIKDKGKRAECIRKATSDYYKSLAKQMLVIAKAYAQKGKTTQAEKYEKRARYYNELSKVILNPDIPIKDARETAKARAGLT